MPILVSQPTGASNLFRAYQPLKFILTETTAYALPPILKIEVTVNTLPYKIPFNIEHTSESLGVYTFEIDLAEYLQEFFVNESTFGGLGTSAANLAVPPASSYNTQFMQQCVWFVNFQTLEASGVYGEYIGSSSTNSDVNYLFNAQALQDSIEDLTPFVTFPLKFFTNLSRKRVACIDNSFFLSFFNADFGKDLAVRVRTYDSLGVLQQTGYIKIGNVAPELRVERIKVGAANINATLAADWDVSGTTAYITSTIAYYEIDLWNLVFTISISEVFTYYIQNDCCEEYIVHYINEFGADDFLFGYAPTTAYQSAGEQFQKILNQFPKPYLRGQTTLQRFGQKTLDLTIRPENPNSLIWLTELINSPNIFLQKKGALNYIAVVINNNDTYTLAQSQRNLSELTISFQLANLDKSQRN